jgi:hypothetical protein
LSGEGSLTHTTDALLEGEESRTHTADSLLQAEESRTHTTDALLLSGDGSLTHNTNTLLLAEETRTHTTDALLLVEESRTHITDALLQAIESLTHTADALLLAEETRTHTTDALLQTVNNTQIHTTDTRLTQVTGLTHSTDALLQVVFVGSGSLVFSNFTLNGSGLFEGPGIGVLTFSNFELNGTGIFIPFYRPSKDNFELPKFSLVGEGSFVFPEPFDPKEHEDDVFYQNRKQLERLWSWGVDGGLVCSKPNKPFRCIITNKPLSGELNPLNEDRPTILGIDTSGGPSIFDLKAFQISDAPAAQKAEARRLARLLDPTYIPPEPEVKEQLVLAEPRFLTSFELSQSLTKQAKPAGSIKEIKKLVKPQVIEPVTIPKPRIQPPQKIATANISVPEPKIQFHQSMARIKTEKRAGRVRSIEATPIFVPAEHITPPQKANVTTKAVAVQEAPPRILESFSIGPRKRKKR